MQYKIRTVKNRTSNDVNRILYTSDYRFARIINMQQYNIIRCIINHRVFCNAMTFAVQSIPSFSVAVSADLAADPHQQANRNSDQKTTASFAVAVQTAVQPTVVGKSHTFYIHTVHLTVEHIYNILRNSIRFNYLNIVITVLGVQFICKHTTLCLF